MENLTRRAVDWITLTGRTDEERAYLLSRFTSLSKAYGEVGHTVRPTRFKGYSANSINNLVLGERQDSVILVAMGKVANDLFAQEVPRMGRCTRLDVCCDIQLSEPTPDLAKDVAYTFAKGYKVGQRTHQPVLTINFEGGQTVYFGKRTGRYLLRLYDRAGKTGIGTLGEVWRAEVQFNDAAAEAALKLFHVKQFDYAQTCHQLVFDKFVGTGIMNNVAVPLGSSNLEFSVVAHDSAKTIEWLRSSVKPAIWKLIDQGLEGEVREALGGYAQLTMLG